jgi:hypothetical protein
MHEVVSEETATYIVKAVLLFSDFSLLSLVSPFGGRGAGTATSFARLHVWVSHLAVIIGLDS